MGVGEPFEIIAKEICEVRVFRTCGPISALQWDLLTHPKDLPHVHVPLSSSSQATQCLCHTHSYQPSSLKYTSSLTIYTTHVTVSLKTSSPIK